MKPKKIPKSFRSYLEDCRRRIDEFQRRFKRSKAGHSKEHASALRHKPPGKGKPAPSSLHKLRESISAIADELEARHREGRPLPARAGERSVLKLGLSAAAVLLLFGAWGFFRAGKDHSLPSTHPTALVWVGEDLWVADWYQESVYRARLGSSGFETVRRYHLEDTHVMGLAVTEDRLYIADSWKKSIQVRRLDEELSLEISFHSPGPTPSALFFDGQHLWSADKDARRIYQHVLDGELTILHSFEVDHEPSGIYVGQGELWSIDAEQGVFYKNDLKTGRTLGAYSLPELRGQDFPLSSFTWKGKRLWVGRDGAPSVLERPWWRLRPKPLPDSSKKHEPLGK